MDRIKELETTLFKAVRRNTELINELDDKIKELEQKANRTGQFHLDAVNEKINKLEHNYKKLEGNIGAVTTAHNMGVELAKEDSAYNHNKIAQLDNKIDEKVDNNARLLQDATRKIFVNIDHINEDFDLVKEDYDILEGKYHQLRSELDCVYKVLEMDALDIQDLYNKLENHPKKKIEQVDWKDYKEYTRKELDNASK